MTLDQNVYVLVGGSMQNREMTYVQISRGGARPTYSATRRRRGGITASLPGWSVAPKRSSRPTPSPVRNNSVKNGNALSKNASSGAPHLTSPCNGPA